MGTGFFRGRGPAGCLHRNTVIFEYKAVLRPVVQLGARQDNGIAAANYITGNFAIDAGAAVNDRCAQGLLILPNHGITADTAFSREQSAANSRIILCDGMVGHHGIIADISTTEVYARIDAEMKRKVFEEKVPNYTPNTTMPWEEDEDLLQWLTQFGKKTF